MIDEIVYLLTEYFGSPDKFTIIGPDQILYVITNVTTTLSIMLGGIAAVSLLIGGIGIMNIILNVQRDKNTQGPWCQKERYYDPVSNRGLYRLGWRWNNRCYLRLF